MNDTILKFGYPETLICEYENWMVLLRPVQVTPGSLILAHKGEAFSMAELSENAFLELKLVTRDIAEALKVKLAPDQINYLALMMVDPHVHFHVIPRYASARVFCGQAFDDRGWPGLPEFKAGRKFDSGWLATAATEFRQVWAVR